MNKEKTFPTDCLPELMAEMVYESARVNRVPECLPGCYALGVVSAAIGSGIEVERDAGKTTRGNLMILVSAESGCGKSEAFGEFVKPLVDKETALNEEFKADTLPGLLADKDAAEGALKRLKGMLSKELESIAVDGLKHEIKDERAKLGLIEAALNRWPRLIVEESTPEQLGRIAEGQAGEAIASLSADAREIVALLKGKYADKGTGEALYLKLFSGDSCRVDRVGRESVILNSPCLAALWALQPDLVKELFASPTFDQSGLMPRILFCEAGTEPTEMPEKVQPIIEHVRKMWYESIAALVDCFRLRNASAIVPCSDEARRLFRDHYNALITRRRSDLRDVQHYAARWTEQAQRIAVGLHAMEHGSNAGEIELAAGTAANAIELADWFAAQQIAALVDRRQDKRAELWERVKDAARKCEPEPIKPENLYRKTRIAKSASDAKQLLEEMTEAGELKREKVTSPKNGGWTGQSYRLPKAG